MNFHRRLSLGFCALFVLCAAAGCGQSSDGGDGHTDGGDGQTRVAATSAPAPLSKAQFIARGDAICEKMDKTQNAALNAYAGKHGNGTKATQEAMVRAAGLPPIKAEIEELDALGAPKGNEAEIQAIIVGAEEAIKEAEADPESINEIGPGNPFNEVDKLAAKYGFKSCDYLF